MQGEACPRPYSCLEKGIDMSDDSDNELRHHGTLWMLNLTGASLMQADAQASVTWECAGPEKALQLSQAMGLATPTEVLQRFASFQYPQAGRRAHSDLAAPARDNVHTISEHVKWKHARGCKCYIGNIEQEIATYGWVSFDDEHIGELDLTIRVPANEAYIWDCATLPAYRGLRLYPALLAFILNELSAEGIARVWIGADEDNVASQKGMALAGFRPMIDIGLFHRETGPRAWIRGRPGISEQELDEACRVIIGAERLVL